MKVASFEYSGRAGYGVIEDDQVRLLSTLDGAPATLADALSAGHLIALAAQAKETVSLADVVLLPVIPRPNKILCVGHNYEDHRKETGRAKVDHPSIFTRFPDTLVAHGAPIVVPRESGNLDYEGELAIVIGTGGRRIPADRALQHVAGFTAFNDASVRDWQWHTHQFTPGKNFPGTGAFGPWMVTPDEIGDLSAHRIETRLNGEVVQSASFSQMIFSVADIIAYCSTFTPLSAGDVILTGTPGGVGAKRTPPLWLRPGDVVEVEISGLGLLHNPVRAEAG
jgi:2-keto-4-pentenoate hydratase/2-oxohepta-3-ene-1,7-dioic acid hydratase in catechol pathway